MRSSITNDNPDRSVGGPLTTCMLYGKRRKPSPKYNSTHPQLSEVGGHGRPSRDPKTDHKLLVTWGDRTNLETEMLEQQLELSHLKSC